jgi:hypothetical protein
VPWGCTKGNEWGRAPLVPPKRLPCGVDSKRTYVLGVKRAASGDDLMIQTLLVWSFGELMHNVLGTDDNGNKIGDELKAIARVSSN